MRLYARRMSEITTRLDAALDVADARLKGGDPHSLGRRVDESREVLASVIEAVRALDARLDESR